MKCSLPTKVWLFLLFGAASGMLGVYWLKSQADIDLFPEFSLSRYFPFSLLKLDEFISQPRGPVNITEGFESLVRIPAPWHKLTTPEPDKVQVSYQRAENGGSRYLVVTCGYSAWWHITYRYVIEVEPGDGFALGAMLWSSSAGGDAKVEISTFDSRGALVALDMWSIAADSTGRFQRVEKAFTIPPGVASIVLRLAGKGAGQFKFDDLSLTSLAPVEGPPHR